MEIKNKSGNVIGKIQIQTSHEKDTLNQIVMNLQPGEGKAMYIADASDHKFTQQTNYAAKRWDQGIELLIEKLSPWQPRFPKDYILKDIQVYYGFDNLTPLEIEDMVEESKQTGTNIVVRDLKPNDKIVGIRMMYDTDVLFQMFGTTKTRIQPDRDTTVTELTIRGYEAFYLKDANVHKLVWIEEDVNGKALQYEISSQHIDQKRMIELAESMI